MVSFRVELGPASHSVDIGKGLLDRLGELAAAAGLKGRCAVITDTNVARLFASRAERSLCAVGFDPLMVEVAPGENSKSIGALRQRPPTERNACWPGRRARCVTTLIVISRVRYSSRISVR